MAEAGHRRHSFSLQSPHTSQNSFYDGKVTLSQMKNPCHDIVGGFNGAREHTNHSVLA